VALNLAGSSSSCNQVDYSGILSCSEGEDIEQVA